MKLLSLEIGDLGKDDSGKDKTFKSLHSGFKVNFHKLTEKGIESMLEFQPFCFAGLNGSGKSNVLEALAAIFYHLEFCVAKFRPENFEKHFRRDTCTPDAFTLKYLIGEPGQAGQVSRIDNLKYLARLITISKVKGSDPKMFVDPNPFKIENGRGEEREVSLKSSDRSQEKAPGKEYLPDLVVGYSSGENEILSIPFIKNRLVHFDEYTEAIIEGYPFKEPETSLLYIDQEMSQAVLLTSLLFEDPDTTLKPLKDELGIQSIQSFRMNLNYQTLVYYVKPKGPPGSMMTKDAARRKVSIFSQFEKEINKLKKCATSWFIDQSKNVPVLSLDFFVDENMKKAIRENYDNTPFKFFRVLQILYELNNNIVTSEIKEEVYKSEGFYTDWKLPTADPKSRVFHFLDFMIVKEIDDNGTTKELLLREFSDGEHQFLHTMGICLILKDRRTLLLLDEPETHFNPGWRAKFIKVLNDSLKAGGTNNFLKDVILTSHSPFIISDCMPDSVILFEKDDYGTVSAQKASELGIDTYGTSVNLLTNRIFKNKETIGIYAMSKMAEFKKRFDGNEKTEDLIEELNNEFGDSIEKLMLIKGVTDKK